MFNQTKFVDKFRNSKPRNGRIKLKENCWKLENNGVVLYDTLIVNWTDPFKTKLNSGGFRTASTKATINATMLALNLKVYVFQRKGQWFVDVDGNEVEFIDGMVIA